MKNKAPFKSYRAHESFLSMRRRCNTPSTGNYHLYGGRGIKICERWNSFENFLADMGERPEGMQLQRVDTNGNYEPSNCKWGTVKEFAFKRNQIHSADLTGQKFNNWCVLKRINGPIKNGGRKYLCRCICGNECLVRGAMLKSNESTQCKQCMYKTRLIPECDHCGCRGHKGKDIDESLCDLIGFCSRCDGFDLEKFRKTYKYTS